MLGEIVLCAMLISVGAQEWNRHTVLDPNDRYHLYWRFNEDVIVFQVEVASTGWIGFGVSPNGGMAGSDVVIGWVSNGKTTFHDRHAEGKFMPAIDEHQDWDLLWSHENETHTVFRFQRKLNTCDYQDFPISDHTTRLIYAYGEEDPASADNVMYHGFSNRGSKSLNLLQGHENRILGSSEDLFHWDIRSPNVEVPEDIETAYFCTVTIRPRLEELHHIIKIEAVIQPGNERYVHHMILYECTDGNETKIEPLLSGYHDCYTEDQTPKFSFCFTVTTGWAAGGETVYLPDDVGLPIGRSNAVYYVLEVHYDNPSYEKGIVDNSGLRLTYTPKLRKYHGGVLAVGNLVYACVFIPPRQNNFVLAGHAHSSCLRQGLPSEGIKIFAALLHSHLAGKKIRVRHFRGKEELPFISSDDNYDFNYQNMLMLPEEHVVLPSDNIIIECTYDTSQRGETTFGGLSTRQEMCWAFLLYYPEVQISFAASCPVPFNLVKVLGVTRMSDDDKFLISPINGKNESYIDFLNSYPWDDNSVAAVQKAMKYSPHLNMCSERGGTLKPIFIFARYPKVSRVYQEPDMCVDRRVRGNVQHYLSSSKPVPQVLPDYIAEQIRDE